ncbi:MAG: nucleotidyltransferase domain-containing protein [bacterium]
MKVGKKKHLGKEEKQRILSNLTSLLSRESFVVFAYVHGSFLSSKGFHDLDVAVYVEDDTLEANMHSFQYDLTLASQIDLALPGITIDLRLLNTAPLNFRYRVVNIGRLLLSKDERKHIAFVAKTRDFFFDFEPHRRLLYETIVLGRRHGQKTK